VLSVDIAFVFSFFLSFFEPYLYRDPTGHFPTISWDKFVRSINAYKAKQRELDIWVGESHSASQGNYLTINLNAEIKFQNFIKESVVVDAYKRPEKNPKTICAKYGSKKERKYESYIHT
jgi:hypothetical protein